MTESAQPVVSAPPRPRRRGDPAGLALCLAMTLLAALPTSALVNGYRHTLDNRPHWVSTKPDLEYSLMGAIAFTVTPVTLATDALNLGAWHGFQEVLVRDAMRPTSLAFRVRLPGESSLSVLYNRTEGGFSGLRLSTSPHHPSVRFRSTPEGRFRETEPLAVPALGDGWHDVHVSFGAGRVTATLDGELLAAFDEVLASSQQVGFRGGVADSFVDDVTIATASDAAALTDDFSPPAGFLWVFLYTVAALVLLLFTVAWLIAWRGDRRRFLHYVLALDLAVLIVATPVYGADRLFLSERHGYSKLYFQIGKAFRVYANPTLGSREDTLARLSEGSAAARPTDRTRVLVIGSSQTWGAGASGEAANMITRLGHGLNARGGDRFEVVNTGVSGAKSPLLYELYEAEWRRWEPDVMVINLGTNDVDMAVYEEQLRLFVASNRKAGVRTVFVLEANAVDSPREPVEPKHAVMRAVARELDVPMIDMHAYLVARKDVGLLWWDHCHLTDAGQGVAADFLAAQLLPLISAN